MTYAINLKTGVAVGFYDPRLAFQYALNSKGYWTVKRF